AAIGDRGHGHRPAHRPDRDLDRVPGVNDLRRLHALAVHVHAPAQNRLGRGAARLEETRGPEPLVDPHLVHVAMITARARVECVNVHERTAMAVGAGGMVAFLLSWILHSRFLRVLGLGAAVAGGAIYARQKFAQRAEKIEAAEDTVRSTLDDL